jgi:hypothetical protein
VLSIAHLIWFSMLTESFKIAPFHPDPYRRHPPPPPPPSSAARFGQRDVVSALLGTPSITKHRQVLASAAPTYNTPLSLSSGALNVVEPICEGTGPCHFETLYLYQRSVSNSFKHQLEIAVGQLNDARAELQTLRYEARNHQSVKVDHFLAYTNTF